MRPSPGDSADHYGGPSRPRTKRPLSQDQPPRTSSEDRSHPRQSTISELFATPQGAPHSPETDAQPRKKVKTTSSHRRSTQSNTPQGMVNPSRIANRIHTVIDLTDPPLADPTKELTKWNDKDGPGFLPHQGAKKLTIKNLKHTQRTTSDDLLKRTWTRVDEALAAIFGGDRVDLSLEELYRGVEGVSRVGKGEELARLLKGRCKEHRDRIKTQLLQLASTGVGNVEVLRVVLDTWTRWSLQVLTIRSIFYYMDRSYLLLLKPPETIDVMTTSLFKTCVFSDQKLKSKIIQAMCELFQNERRGHRNMTDASLLRDGVKMVHALAAYATEFESELLKTSWQYFSLWADQESTDCTLANYVKKCTAMVDSEMARCDSFNLDTSTRRELLTMLEGFLIRQKVDILVDIQAVSELLDAHALEVLQLLYLLLQRLHLQIRLKGPWQAWIKSVGSSIVQDEQRQGEMVIRLLDLRTKVDRILKTCFRKHERLSHALRESFRSFINGRSNSQPGEMIAKYIDMILRGGVKAIPSTLGSGAVTGTIADHEELDSVPGDEEAELSKQLDRVLELFRFIEGKDVFEAFYKKDLARRLLMGRSASADAERIMLAKLRNECGAAFTHNLEQMFKDVDLAKDEMASYKQRREERGSTDGVDLNVNVLSSAAWPSYPDVPVNIPKDIMKAIDGYTRYYKAKHSSRKLEWKHALAHCVVKAKFPRGNKELVVSSFQTIVMLLFNEAEDGSSLSYEQIKATTGLSDAELMRTLQSLACAKYRVLAKSPKGREVNRTDKFSLNLQFSDVKYRIKINQIQLKETKEENRATHEDVARDRQYEAQAAIVRILKSRKSVSATELMVETIGMTKNRGALDATEIKKQIDQLIEKDYMERVTENNQMVYKYMA
ncbi:MAG: hypothetical protein M1816_004756 [Peltula sp. TS41687]|nr:MAG: hypothetical protein M1816_004756 [Peltula sp. TS41687]